MNIVDILLQLINWVAQKLLLPLLPNNMPAYPLETLQASLTGLEGTIKATLGGWGVLFPIGLALMLVTIVISAELSLFVYRIVKYVMELIAKR